MSVEAPSPVDPKGLIREAYRIEGITEGECRSILIDWALSLPPSVDPRDAAATLLAAAPPATHPMTALLQLAQTRVQQGGRRGGRAGRFATGGSGGGQA